MFDKSTDHENDVMMAQFVCLFLVCAIFRETSTEMDVQTVNVIVFFCLFFFYNNMVYTLIDHRNDVKTFKTLQ